VRCIFDHYYCVCVVTENEAEQGPVSGEQSLIYLSPTEEIEDDDEEEVVVSEAEEEVEVVERRSAANGNNGFNQEEVEEEEEEEEEVVVKASTATATTTTTTTERWRERQRIEGTMIEVRFTEFLTPTWAIHSIPEG
jgi:hypothetical protein